MWVLASLIISVSLPLSLTLCLCFCLCQCFCLCLCISLYMLFCLFFSLFIFIRYFLSLHFKCYPLSWFSLWEPHIPSAITLFTNPPIPANLSWHSSILGYLSFSGPRPYSPFNVHHLLHMQLDPRVPPCVLSGWWFSPLGALEYTDSFILLFLLWGCKLLWSFLYLLHW